LAHPVPVCGGGEGWGVVAEAPPSPVDPPRRRFAAPPSPFRGGIGAERANVGNAEYYGAIMPASNVDKQSLRGFLRMVEQDFPDEILRIREPVGLRQETTALVFELERAGRQPVVVFDNVAGGTMPLGTNVAANRRLLAACLGVTSDELPTAFRERCQRYIPCELVKEAAWNEVVIEGDDVDLTKLPIPLQFKVDAAPYITGGQLSARDPVTGVDTTGFH